MKKFIKLLISLTLVFSTIGCSSKNEESNQTTKQETEQKDSLNEKDLTLFESDILSEYQLKSCLDEFHKLEVEDGLLKITLSPSDDVGWQSQEYWDELAGSFYTKAKVNDDGSITYWMTETEHILFMLIITPNWHSQIKDLSNNYLPQPNIIKHNDEYSQFDITISRAVSKEITKNLIYLFFEFGGSYNLLCGKTNTIVVNFYDTDGVLISSVDSTASSTMREYFDND